MLSLTIPFIIYYLLSVICICNISKLVFYQLQFIGFYLKKRRRLKIVILFIFLLTAVYSDWRFGKIYNWQIMLGILSGLGFRYYETGTGGLLLGMVSFLIPVILLFPLFRIGTFGGGDVKLLAAAAIFMTPAQTILFLGIAFLAGAFEALFKMIKERNFVERLQYLMSYIHDVLTTNQWKLYEEAKKQSEEETGRHKIHFAFPVFISALIHMGGLY